MAVQELFAYLCVKRAAEAIDFYTRAFGAREKFRLTEPGGRIGHAELDFGVATVMLADEFPERAFSVEYALKDMEYLLDFAKQVRAELKGARRLMEALERAAEAGHGKKYFPVLVKTI